MESLNRLKFQFEREVNPLLQVFPEALPASDKAMSTPNVDLIEYERKLQTLERKVGAYKRLQWQRFSFSAYIEKGVVPRGLRVLKMPSYGNTYPDLLKQWQCLNLKLSHDYMVLMNNHFQGVELELKNEIISMEDDLFALPCFENMLSSYQSMIDRLSALDDRLEAIKKRKLIRDIKDFQCGNIFSWPKNESFVNSTNKSGGINSKKSANMLDTLDVFCEKSTATLNVGAHMEHSENRCDDIIRTAHASVPEDVPERCVRDSRPENASANGLTTENDSNAAEGVRKLNQSTLSFFNKPFQLQQAERVKEHVTGSRSRSRGRATTRAFPLTNMDNKRKNSSPLKQVKLAKR